MIDDDSYPYLPRPVLYLYRVAYAFAELFAVRDINSYKVNSLFALAVNLLGRLI